MNKTYLCNVYIKYVTEVYTDFSWSLTSQRILRFVDRASRYIRVMKTNSMHYLSSVYFVNQPLHEFHPNPPNRESIENHNTYQLLYIYSIPPDDGLQICLKHVEVDVFPTVHHSIVCSRLVERGYQMLCLYSCSS